MHVNVGAVRVNNCMHAEIPLSLAAVSSSMSASHQMGAPNFCLELLELTLSEHSNDLLQAARLDLSRHIII